MKVKKIKSADPEIVEWICEFDGGYVKFRAEKDVYEKYPEIIELKRDEYFKKNTPDGKSRRNWDKRTCEKRK